MSIFGIDTVFAQDPTPTPSSTPTLTSTWEPLYKTSTPRPLYDYSCPVGTPWGWGTITPASDWLDNCGHCLPTATLSSDWPTLAPTYTPAYVFDTPTPGVGTVTVTPQASITPTVASSATFPAAHYYWYSPMVSSQILGEGTNNNASSMYWYWDISTVNYCPGGDEFRGELSYLTAVNLGGWQRLAFKYYANVGGERQYLTNWAENSNISQWFGAFKNDQDYDWAVLNGAPIFIGGTDLHVTTVSTIGGADIWAGSSRIILEEKRALCYGVHDPVFAHTPTPIPENSYCSYVGWRAYDNLDLPEIIVGPPQCADIMPNVNIDLAGPASFIQVLFGGTATFPDSLQFQGLRVCMRPIKLGYLSLFDIQFDMDIIIYIMAFVAVYRWILRAAG